MKIKCVRLECEVCYNLASIQVFYNNEGAIKYGRARHYSGQKEGKPQFEYHQQSIDYLKGKLGHDQIAVNDDLKEAESNKLLGLEPSAGFGPATITLPR
jgi:hypothetical protein